MCDFVHTQASASLLIRVVQSGLNCFISGIYTAMIAENCPMGSNPRVAVQSIILQGSGAGAAAAASEMRSTRDAMYRRALGPAYSPSLAQPAQN